MLWKVVYSLFLFNWLLCIWRFLRRYINHCDFFSLVVEKGGACLTVVGTRPLFWEAQEDPGVELSGQVERGSCPVGWGRGGERDKILELSKDFNNGQDRFVYGLGGVKQSSAISGPSGSAVKITGKLLSPFLFLPGSRDMGSWLYTWLQEMCLVLSGY